MKATVVVSCYKQEKYIEECLLSILTQEVNFDYEILVGDDASPDQTPFILKRLAEKFPEKIKLILRSKNLGAAENYIDLHNEAAGDIVFHFDGDDIMLPGKLQKQFDIFSSHDNVNLCFHRSRYFSDDGEYVQETGTPAFIKDRGGSLFSLRDLSLWGTIAVHGTYAYRKSSRRTKSIDREFMEWFFAMDSLVNGGDGFYIDEVLMKYRCNPSGEAYLSSSKGKLKAYDLYFQDVSYYNKSLKKQGRELYANYLFGVIVKLKNKFLPSLKDVEFLICNSNKFNISLLLEVFRIRKSVSPLRKNR